MKIRDLQQPINEIDRRGFLKGMGAAAVAGAAGTAMAAPFSHGEFADQMTGKTQGKYSVLRSDNSKASITIKWPGSNQPGFVITVPGEVLQLGIRGAGGRIKINDKVEDIYFHPMSDHGAYSSAGVLSDSIARKLLKSNGEVLIQIPVVGKGEPVYKFTVEPDSIVKQLKDPQPKKPEVKKDADNGPSKTTKTNVSSGYIENIRTMVANYIEYPSASRRMEEEGTVTVRVEATDDGTITGTTIVKSSGHSRLDATARVGIGKLIKLPSDTDGQIPTTIDVPITFKLDMRQANLDRMSGQGNTPSASYAGRIQARIKPNITFTDEVQGNPKAEVEVRTSSDGTILGRKLLSSSGNRSWDEAVLRAIDRTATLPRDMDGRVPPVIVISFRPKD